MERLKELNFGIIVELKEAIRVNEDWDRNFGTICQSILLF